MGAVIVKLLEQRTHKGYCILKVNNALDYSKLDCSDT